MASGTKRSVHGAFAGTGATKDITTIGFRPTRVKIFTAAGGEGWWQEEMADGSAFKRLANGTGSVVSSNGITPLASGFRIGAEALLNASGTRIYYEAQD